MMTGAGQGGTAGGMKITTVAVMIIMVFCFKTNRSRTTYI